jgi:hypothetical protein
MVRNDKENSYIIMVSEEGITVSLNTQWGSPPINSAF